ncbi:MAG: ClC family H(+)/Cl(-) exchange transporter [Lactobacillaceae bacterium]|nr:ClC family H(+)/Cl(-) exchange transporter [Lactobacillaceae bacterium]
MQVNQTKVIVLGRAIVVGLGVGIVVSSFRWLIGLIFAGWLQLYKLAHQSAWWIVGLILLMVVLTWVVGWIIKPDPNVGGSGIPQVEGQLAGQLKVNAWSVLWRKYLAGLITIGSGALLGREGPSIQLGAAVGQMYAQFRKADEQNQRLMIATGAAAGLSAAFGAPIAGAMFIMEEVYRSFSVLVWLGALTGALMADLVASQIFGLKPVLALQLPANLPIHYWGYLVIFGALLGVFGIAYQRITLWSGSIYRVFAWLPRQYHFALVFAVLLPMGYFIPALMGGGAELIMDTAHTMPLLPILLVILVIRFIVSAISFGSGVPGGIFLPILTLGAIGGAVFGSVLSGLHLLPSQFIPYFMMVGMAGYFAGISKAPFTGIILIAEMVGSMSQLVGMGIVALTAYIVVDMLGGAPIYESLLQRLNLQANLAELTGHVTDHPVVVALGSRFENSEIRSLTLPKGVLITRIVRAGRDMLPNGDFVLQVGDEMHVLVDDAHFAAVWAKINQLNHGE